MQRVSRAGRRAGAGRGARTLAWSAVPEPAVAAGPRVVAVGSASVRGTVRDENQDRIAVDEFPEAKGAGLKGMYSIFDGHGGTACSEWLQTNLHEYILDAWPGQSVNLTLRDAYLRADKELLKPQGWFKPRGVGGEKCGSTNATALLFSNPNTGETVLVSSNLGDSRVYLVRGKEIVMLSEDHIPTFEKERDRIEAFNPNPLMPMVRKVGDTWRVGGLLALSRAFGDAFMKSSGQFEGIPEGGDGYVSGFGLIAEPHVRPEILRPEDSYIIISSDGMFANEERGGGSGLDEKRILRAVRGAKAKDLDKVCEKMVLDAQKAGSTDDTTVLVLKLEAD